MWGALWPPQRMRRSTKSLTLMVCSSSSGLGAVQTGISGNRIPSTISPLLSSTKGNSSSWAPTLDNTKPREAFPLVKYMPHSICRYHTKKWYQCQGTRQKGLVKLPGQQRSWNYLSMKVSSRLTEPPLHLTFCSSLYRLCNHTCCGVSQPGLCIDQEWVVAVVPDDVTKDVAVMECCLYYNHVLLLLLRVLILESLQTLPGSPMTSRHSNSAPCNKSSHSQTSPHTHTLRPQYRSIYRNPRMGSASANLSPDSLSIPFLIKLSFWKTVAWHCIIWGERQSVLHSSFLHTA